jgi:large subunit ribosomal protein L15
MTLKIDDLKPASGSTHAPKRVGRGRSSGHGKTCGRGTKGQKARSKTRQGFEGGQMPLQRRVPKLRGFKPRAKKQFHLVNVETLNRFADGEAVSPEALVEKGILKKLNKDVKILGRGAYGESPRFYPQRRGQNRGRRGKCRGGLGCFRPSGTSTRSRIYVKRSPSPFL